MNLKSMTLSSEFRTAYQVEAPRMPTDEERAQWERDRQERRKTETEHFCSFCDASYMARDVDEEKINKRGLCPQCKTEMQHPLLARLIRLTGTECWSKKVDEGVSVGIHDATKCVRKYLKERGEI